MRLTYLSLSDNLARLNNGTPRFHQETGGGIFNAAKFYAVTTLLWSVVLSVCACAWVGAWAIGASLSAWVGK